MVRKRVLLLCLPIILVSALVACGGSPGGEETPSGEVALKITGNVEHEMAWTEAEVHSMDTIEVESTNKEGEVKSYTGVPINALLKEAGVSHDATTVTFVAEDDSTADTELSEVLGCGDCIVSFRNKGGLSIVMPGYGGKLQVKAVVEVQVN